jgi:hypothetical protein
MTEKQLLCCIVAGVFDIAAGVNYANDCMVSFAACSLAVLIFGIYVYFIK